MKEAENHFFKSVLLSQKSAILNKTAELKQEQMAGQEPLRDEAEVASTDSNLRLTLQLHERDRLSLLQIEKALTKISDGTYGQCEACSERISELRLKARPLATLCIDCMEEQEAPRPQL